MGVALKILMISCLLLLASNTAAASETIIDEPGGDSYHFVSHYSVEIKAPVETVWKHLIDLGSWMYDFEMQSVAGLDDLEGRVLRLYEGQDFYVQITKVVPEELLVIANLPAPMEGERLSSGISVTTLTEKAGLTLVQLTMSRRYTWSESGENHLKSRRKSKEFKEKTRATWNRFLGRLSALSTSQ